MIGQLMASLPPSAFATMFPLVFYAMDKAGGYGELTAAAFFSNLPPPAQEAYPAWKAAFETDFLAVLESLKAPAAPTAAAPIIDGFRTPTVDVSDLQYQADARFMPDKGRLWKTPASHDGWVHAHNAIRFEIGELKRVLEALGTAVLAEWQVHAVKTWWAGHA